MASEEIVVVEEGDNLPALRMTKGQLSYNGLQAIGGVVAEECNRDLRWPDCMETYKKMFKDATIAPALNMMEMEIAKSEWTVKIPEGHDEALKSKAEFLKSLMDDMEHTWNDFIRQASTFNRYGFAPVEKVYYKRTRANGSKHNDGYYGLKSLPLIAQDSIASWRWSTDGRKLTGLKQWINIPAGEDDVQNFTRNKQDINRNKFLLFRADPQKDSPIGTSPLNSVYIAWRYKTEFEKHEAMGVSSDLRGLKVFKIPAMYMSDSATPEQKATYEMFKEILRSLHAGEQSGVIVPQAFNEQGMPLFDFELKSVMGQATHDINVIIQRFRKEIITGILAPQLIIGQDGSGSFALATSLENITKTVVTSRLKEIRDQLNHDLVKQVFQLNGWDTTVMPYFDFTTPDEESLEEIGKFIQRVASVGMLKVDPNVANWIAEQAGMPKPFDDINIPVEEMREQMSGYESKSGEGGAAGSGNGTGTSAASRDNSTANLEN